MPIPSQPTNVFIRPFADAGTKQIIPNAQQRAGRASLLNGFPTETQVPLREGGIAPNRTDFNGILYMLSAFAFWQQSGGQWTYLQALNYVPPCIVFYGEKLWWCLDRNGPETSAGVVVPGSNSNVWKELFTALAEMSGQEISVDKTPVGALIFYCGATQPDGYFFCNGQSFSATTYPKLYAVLGNRSSVPDYRGLFLRSIGGNSAAQGVVRPSSIGPHAHGIPGRIDPGGGIAHDQSRETDIGVERNTITGSTQTTGTSIGSETVPVHVAQMLCIKHD
jgi:microcystin-dependent protein